MNKDIAIHSHISLIGQGMVRCGQYCEGIHLEPSNGVLPRALNLEERMGEHGSVALGINPGKGDRHEETFYLEQGSTYEAMERFWTEFRRDNHQYHVRTRRFIDACGLSGSILWTELVKCQNAAGIRGVPPLKTLRTCVHLYLVREMAAVPATWPVIAIGKKPFELAAMIFPSRTVIGIPHPTGAYGLFPKLFDVENSLHPKFADKIAGTLAADIPAAVWLEVPK